MNPSRGADVALSPSEAMRLIKAADEALAARKVDVAMQCYRRVIELEPKALRPRLGLYRSAVLGLRRDEALAVYGDIRDRKDLPWFERFAIAKGLEEVDAYAEAEAEYLRYLDHCPEDAEAHRRRAALAHRRWEALAAVRGGMREAEVALCDAKIALRTVIALEPEDAAAHMNLAALWVDEGVSVEGAIVDDIASRALKTALRSIELNPQNEGAYKVLGDVHLSLRAAYAEAIAAYEKALAIDPHYADARAMVGVTYLKMGNEDEAREVFEHVLRDDPTNETAQQNLSNI
ncbi:MAG: tetratricopeptide repeat protein [Deltaproteobacteria bacterium]|nr:tetratricopeptide repeat protein [Deltaproteobacteria bacterium]